MNNEPVKTMIYAATAVVILGIAWATQPSVREVSESDYVNRVLFEDFTDPGDAAQLEITHFDKNKVEQERVQTFTVARQSNGLWTLPSRSGYPADAEDRMKDAATRFIGLKALGVVADEEGKDATALHKLYGVLEPGDDIPTDAEDSVGLAITVKNKNDDVLAGLIVGNEVEGAADQRYVRVPGQDLVYQVKIDPDKFSTEFSDWIEKDLLQLSSFDIEDVNIFDYTVARVPVRDQFGRVVVDPLGRPRTRWGLEQRFDAFLHWQDSNWELKELVQYTPGQQPIRELELPPGEALNKETLNELKSAVDDLKIVDVHRKPKWLGDALKKDGEFPQSGKSVEELVNRGFVAAQSLEDPSRIELKSANGEVHISMQDAVKYILRFGRVVSIEKGESAEDSKANRYLFVVAEVDESKLTPPILEDLPKLPANLPMPEKTEEDGDSKEDSVAEEAKILAEQKRIETENNRKLDAYKESRETAEKRVAELNGRFADWYYVVSDDMFKKIRLDRDSLFVESDEAAQEGVGLDAFRELQEGGLEKGPME